MKLNLTLIILIISASSYSQSSIDPILDKTIKKLELLTSIEYKGIYQYKHEEVNASKEVIDSAVCFFDFTSTDTLLGAKYHFLAGTHEEVFSGEKEFFATFSDKRVLYTTKPNIRNVSGSFFIRNSIYTIKRNLSEIINDSDIIIERQNDSIIYGEDVYYYKIKMNNKWINSNIGNKITTNKWGEIEYELFISKKTYLPKQFNSIYSNKKGYTKGTYLDIKIPAKRESKIWGFDRYPEGYTIQTDWEYIQSMNKERPLLLNNKLAPDWTLPSLNGDSINLSDYKGKFVLLEFWFPYCKACVKAVPVINEIKKKYQNKDLEVIGVEYTGYKLDLLKAYIKKQNVKYITLYSGELLAKKYKVNAAPSFFLINKEGTIIYSSFGFNEIELIKAIEKNVK